MKTKVNEKIKVLGMSWKMVALTVVCNCFFACTAVSTDTPYSIVSNDLITAKLYLPDMEKGYYQATRFDWAGVIAELELMDHSYFGQWFANYDPKTHDAILGPVESFSEIGYREAEIGGEFLRIGVGGLRKEDDSRFDNFKLYPISNPGKWKVKKSKNQVVFTHEVKDVAGYSYLYTKTVRLPEGKPELIIEHTLKNTGKKTIITDVYNHNFFIIDHEPTGPNIKIGFPFEVTGKWNREDNPAVIDRRSIKYTRDLQPRESVFMGDLLGHNQTVEDYDFRIENLKTGAGVRITCDRPVSKIVYWASATTSCPEPYIDINVPVGEQFTWTNTYEFYTRQSKLNEIDRSIAALRKGELTVKAKGGEQITIEQISHQFWFGCAIANNPFNGSMPEEETKQYKEKFLANFNAAVTENAVKWGNMEREKGQVNYSLVDNILEWTTENKIPLRGHNVFWGISRYVQPWLKEMDDMELEQTLKDRAETLATRYKGRFAEYDLNNEMIHGNYYEDRLGPEITKKMAEWMHNGDPEANLYLNDYDITTGNKLPEYMAHIRTLLQQGVPIAGIGVQGHLHAETFDRYELKRSLDSLALFNLPICITEFNMPGQRSKYMNDRTLKMTAEEEAINAAELVDFYRICFAHPAVKGIIMWGFWENANWLPASSMYRADWTATPTADAYHDLVFGEWWTKTSGIVDRNGTFSTTAFYGKYKITADGITKIVDFDRNSDKVLVDFTK